MAAAYDSHLKYSALEDGCIRLLQLEPANDRSALIRCSFITVRLADRPAYEALSYVWGTYSQRETIRVATADVSVTTNLFLALSSLRHPDTPRTLWVDALCINQADVEERSRQVSIMGLIYTEADNVVVYLGEEWDDHKIAYEYLEAAGGQGEAHFVASLAPHLEVGSWHYSRPILT